jgi:pimeloyl-ACP methyl ester carboxylesterase
MAIALGVAMAGLSGTSGAQTAAGKPEAKASMESFQLPSHGALLNALVYVAAGEGPHPVVVLLHGFPGNEKNLDLAQDMRRAGYDVLYFDYRGSWGSPGEFSFTHCIEDGQAAVAYLRERENAKRFRADPKRIILIGHSMGGFVARFVGAKDPGIEAVGMISAADMGVDTVEAVPLARRAEAVPMLAHALADEGMAPLAGCTPKSLAQEVVAHADAWNTPRLAPKLAGMPLLVVTSDDGLQASNDAFVAAVPKADAAHVTAVHFATDHAYSDKRLELSATVLAWLRGVERSSR